MNYTDALFTIPVRIYDGFSIKRAQKREEAMEMPVDGDWVEGTIDIPFQEIKALMDYYSKGRAIEDVEKEGFDCTIVMTNTLGEFVANIPKTILKTKLNKFVDWYYDEVEQEVGNELEEKELSLQFENKPKKTFWQRFRR